MVRTSAIKDGVLITGQQIKLTGHEMALASGNDLITHCSSCYVLVCFSDMENMCNWVFVQLGAHLALWTFGTFYTFELYPDTFYK